MGIEQTHSTSRRVRGILSVWRRDLSHPLIVARRVGSVRFPVLILAGAVLSCGDGGDSGTEPDPLDPCVQAIAAIPQPVADQSGLVVYQDCVEVLSWNHEQDGESWGEIVADVGTTTHRCEVRVLDHRLDREPVSNRPGVLELDDDCLALAWTVSDSSIATLEPIRNDPWGFVVRGNAAGRTTVTLSVKPAEGAAVLTSGPLDLIVEDPVAFPPDAMDFAIVLDGVRKVFVVDGVVVPSCGSTNADPGYLHAGINEVSEGHYSFRELNPTNCRATTFEKSTHHLAFEFKDPCICGVVNHPEHYDVKTTFHLEGFVAGTTDMRIRLFEGSTLKYISPWIPIVVTE